MAAKKKAPAVNWRRAGVGVPCPCGSGRTFDQCHGLEPGNTALEPRGRRAVVQVDVDEAEARARLAIRRTMDRENLSQRDRELLKKGTRLVRGILSLFDDEEPPR